MKALRVIKGDIIIWTCIIILLGFSSLAVYSSSSALAYKFKGGHPEYFLFKHIFLAIIGCFIIYYIHKIKNLKLSTIGLIAYYLSIPLLLWTLISGVRSGEATRWIEIPGLGITFQSSDIAKAALILFISRNIAVYSEKYLELKQVVVKLILPAAITCGIILVSNFSTAFLLFITVLYLMYIGNIPLKNLLKITGIIMAFGILFVVLIYFVPQILPRGKTWKARIENFSSKDSKSNYQVEQAKIAIANGIFFGKGPGNSMQRAFLPQASSDFIYAIIIEEYGFIGLIIPFLYFIIFFRSIRIAQKCTKPFHALVVAGLSFNLMLQTVINIAVAVNLLPVTGQPLPFISMGGTSILFSCINIGIILNISRQVNEGSPENEQALLTNQTVIT